MTVDGVSAREARNKSLAYRRGRLIDYQDGSRHFSGGRCYLIASNWPFLSMDTQPRRAVFGPGGVGNAEPIEARAAQPTSHFEAAVFRQRYGPADRSFIVICRQIIDRGSQLRNERTRHEFDGA